MGKSLRIRDLTLRDGQQSQFATRMNHAQVERVLPYYREAKFHAMEVWGGAVPDSIMRYLNENPWDRLSLIRDGVAGASKLTALSRGRNLFGYNPYPESVIKGFCVNAVGSGIDIMRIFDALNDVSNIESSIRYVKEAGGMADCAVCFTQDPKFTFGDRVRAFFSGKKLANELFTVDYFVGKAKEMEAAGADMISIKDMAGLLEPAVCHELVTALKGAVSIPVDLHTHCTPGFGVATLLASMIAGVDIVDTVVMNFSGGPAAPAYEIIQLFADRLGLDTGVNRAAVAKINAELRGIRAELEKFDQFKRLPPEFGVEDYNLSSELGLLFDDATNSAKKRDWKKTLEYCQKIEAAYNYPEPDEIVRVAQIPGGMYTNMMAQLKELKLENHLDDVLAIVPKVRLDSGVPPLVTPTSQIVGVQAVNLIVDKAHGKPYYTNVSRNFADLVKGTYGHTPFPVDPAFREKICGVRDETPYDVSKYKPQSNDPIAELGDRKLAENEKDGLLLELFPSVADKYLRGVRKAEYEKWLSDNPPPPPKPERYPDSFWEGLAVQAGS